MTPHSSNPAAPGRSPDANAVGPSCDEIAATARSGPLRIVTTSWDDGHPLDLRVAELLAKYGLAGTFYIPRSSQRPVMLPAQIRELSSQFEIGGHTLEHICIDRLSDAAASLQLSASREWLEQLTGRSCAVFCFPGGRFRKAQLPLVRQAGYRAARTVELLSTSLPCHVCGLALIPTTVQAFPHGPRVYAINALKRWSLSSALWSERCSWTRDWVRLAERLLQRVLARGGVFHLWGHSWEIAERSQWGNLEAVLETMSSCPDVARTIPNSGLCDLSADAPRTLGRTGWQSAPASTGEK